MYEGVPTYPDAGRLWRIAERLGVTTLHTAPPRSDAAQARLEPARYNYRFKHA
jgi:acetyl-CoA synthetase